MRYALSDDGDTVNSRLRALLFAIASLVVAGTASASQWVSTCEETLCLFRQEISAPNADGTTALFEILIEAETAEASLVVTTPLGIATEPGVRLIVDGQEWQANVRVCQPDGCRAAAQIDSNDLAILLQRTSIEIRFFIFGSEYPVSLELPIDGLIRAMAEQRQ